MKKNILKTLVILLLTPFLLYGIYKLIEYLDYKSSISSLNQYQLVDNEKIVKKFKYKKYEYIISRYYDNTSSWSHINFLVNDNNKYYILENIKKCDLDDEGFNLYVKDNETYIHCIGKEGIVDKYLINDFSIEKETFNFNYSNTPNISQLHIGIEKVDNDFIYLYSEFKVDSTIKDEPRVKCSFIDKICTYS